MAEDSRTLWIGNLEDKVTDELLFELCLQTGPVDRLILPSEGEGDDKKHKGHAYVVFKHPESVQYATQVLEGTSMFSKPLSLKARSLPLTYRKEPPPHQGGNHNSNYNNRFEQRSSRFDNSSLRGGYNRHHSRDDFTPRGRGGGGYRGGRSGGSYNAGYNNYNNQSSSSGGWMANQQQDSSGSSDNQAIQSYNTEEGMQSKRQRVLQQQNITLQAHQQQVQQMANQIMNSYQHQQQQQSQQQQQQQNWANSGYHQDWSQGSTEMYQQYTTNQYGGNWYQSQ